MNTLTNSSPSNGYTGLKYFLVGSGIGAAAALLLAPKSGSELRNDIAEVSKRGYDGTLDLARKVKDQSTDLYHSLLDGSVTDVVSDTVAAAKEFVSDTTHKVADTADELLSIDGQPRNANAGRKSTNIV